MKDSFRNRKLQWFKMSKLQAPEKQSYTSRPWTGHPFVKTEAFGQIILGSTMAWELPNFSCPRELTDVDAVLPEPLICVEGSGILGMVWKGNRESAALGAGVDWDINVNGQMVCIIWEPNGRFTFSCGIPNAIWFQRSQKVSCLLATAISQLEEKW